MPESIYSLSDIILKNSVENMSSGEISLKIPKESSESLNFSFEANKQNQLYDGYI